MQASPQAPLRRRKSESGIALLMALVVVMILALLSAALTNVAVSEYQTAAALDSAHQAVLAAEAGAEAAFATLRPISDWTSSGGAGTWQSLLSSDFPTPASGVARVGDYSVSAQRPTGLDPSTSIRIRSIGSVRGATRTIELDLVRLTGSGFTTYSIRTVDITSIPGGGSLQWHGSAYFETDLVLKGGSQAGIYNDRKVFTTDPGFQNNLYVKGNLDVSTGNPTIGDPYYFLHVAGGILGSSNKVNVSNLDGNVPPPFYPDVLGAAQDALTNPGNLLVPGPGGTGRRFRYCQWNGSGWSANNINDPDPNKSGANLNLTGTSATDVFFLPPATANPGSPCAGYANSIATVRSGGQYMLMWDPTNSAGNGAQLVSRNDALPIYIPGKALVNVDVRYEGRATVVIASQPTASVPGNLAVQIACALDLNGNGTCSGPPNTGRTVKARISPCQGSPGTDNPATTFPRSDVLAFIVNGSAYSNLNANSCDQEMNLIAVVGDRNASNPSPGAVFTIQKKLQWYGVLMAREMDLAQVPDFWQMPDLGLYLPPPLARYMRVINGPVAVRNWRELL